MEKGYMLQLYAQDGSDMGSRQMYGHQKRASIYIGVSEYIITKTWIDENKNRCATLKKVAEKGMIKVCGKGGCKFIPAINDFKIKIKP